MFSSGVYALGDGLQTRLRIPFVRSQFSHGSFESRQHCARRKTIHPAGAGAPFRQQTGISCRPLQGAGEFGRGSGWHVHSEISIANRTRKIARFIRGRNHRQPGAQHAKQLARKTHLPRPGHLSDNRNICGAQQRRGGRWGLQRKQTYIG